MTSRATTKSQSSSVAATPSDPYSWPPLASFAAK